MFVIDEGGLFHDAVGLAKALAQETIGQQRLALTRIVTEGKGLTAAPLGQLVHPLSYLAGRVVLYVVVDENHGAKVVERA